MELKKKEKTKVIVLLTIFISSQFIAFLLGKVLTELDQHEATAFQMWQVGFLIMFTFIGFTMAAIYIIAYICKRFIKFLNENP